MSRLIVKNLPNKVTAEHLKEVFGQKGEVTDVQLKFTKDGKFRNFGFIGYRTEEQAMEAKEYFNDTCIRSMKIQVDTCANLGDKNKPRAWSKYAPDSAAFKSLHKDNTEKKVEPKKKQKSKDKIKELLKKHKDDPLFAEFINAHVNEKTSWIKDTFDEINNEDNSDSELQSDPTKSDSLQQKDDKCDVKQPPADKIANKNISDLDYMKILMRKVDPTSVIENKDNKKEDEEKNPKKVRNRQLFHVKITGLPFKCKKIDIKQFFRPLVPYTIRLPLGKQKKLAGFCYVGFRTEKELKKALDKDKLFLGNHRVYIHKYENIKKENEKQEEDIKRRNQENYEESVGESGSIFVRNLPYVVSEEEVTKLFEKYGPIADVNMPIDKVLRQPKGFATVTFLMPEHAVKAFTELDGTAFCGRMLHLLPAKSEKLEEEKEDEGLSFKEKKTKMIKAQSKSSHNWNTLFLDANAVADVITTNYNTTKEKLLLDNVKGKSAAVRLALGETQLVAETRAFLEKNGVFLEAFNKPPKARSKTCILVKNLPANTNKDEIKSLFEKHGPIARCIMPKHGITALVDFIEPFEAKNAFSKLAYSQFKSAPLYLEWAPENVFKKTLAKTETNENNNEEIKEDIKESKMVEQETTSIKEDDNKNNTMENIEPENDTTLFVKNLNFETNEDKLNKHFSRCGQVFSATVAKKKDPKNPGQFLSMGYGFVQFYRKDNVNEALKLLQSSTLDGKTLELKRSERGNKNDVVSQKKSTKTTVQNGTKILVRNVPFQADRQELHEIFRAFGEIKTLRLPKKLSPGTDQHRGFAFVDYHTKSDAKSAFEALCHSTHLYGRRLVLEWADQTDEVENVDVLRKRTAQSFNARAPGGKKSRKATVDPEAFVEGDK